jgi:homoaconitase/3-isopropylmalate dehydratase large subunit
MGQPTSTRATAINSHRSERRARPRSTTRDMVVLSLRYPLQRPTRTIAAAPSRVRVVREFAWNDGLDTKYLRGRRGRVEHALLPELVLVGPGDVVVGAGLHTCTYGGLGAFATGMGLHRRGRGHGPGETWFKVPPPLKVQIDGELPEYVGGIRTLILEVIGRIGGGRALTRPWSSPRLHRGRPGPWRAA